MRRRQFLKGLLALPLVPAALRRWAEAPADADEGCPGCTADPAEHPAPPSDVLGVAMGEPTAVSVVTSGQVLKVVASAYLIDGGSVKIKQDTTTIAYYQSGPGQELVAEAIVHPPAGLHTYRLVAEGPVQNHAVSRPFIMVRAL